MNVRKQVAMRVDYLDQCCTLWEKEREVYDENRIENLMKVCAQKGITEIHWRTSLGGKVSYPSKVMEPFNGCYSPQSEGLRKAMESFDPLEIATKYARKYGLSIYPWVTMFDSFFIGMEDPLFRKKPGLLILDRSQKIPLKGIPCYAEPEVQEYRLAEVKELLDNYDIDGIMYGTNTHCWLIQEKERYHTPLFYGYNAPVVTEFKKRYGINILKEKFDPVLFRRLHGEFVLQYLRRIQKECTNRNKKLIITVISMDPRCLSDECRNENILAVTPPLPDSQKMICLEVKKMLDEGVVDTYVWSEDKYIFESANGYTILKEGKKRKKGTKPCYHWLVHVRWGKKTKEEMLRFSEQIRYARENDLFDGISFHEIQSFEFYSPQLWELIKEYQK